MTRYAIVGFGVMGQNHARALEQVSGAELVAVVEPTQPDTSELTPYRKLNRVEELRGLGIEAAIVATPTETHERVSLDLMEMGAHVLVEKPLSINFQSCSRMREVCNTRGLVGAVGHIERFSAVYDKLQNLLARQDFGKCLQVETRRVGPGSGRIRDVGVALDLGTHDIDLVSSLLATDYRQVYARQVRTATETHEVGIVAVGELENGVAFSHIVNVLNPEKSRELSLIFEKAVIVGNFLSGIVEIRETASGGLTRDVVSYSGGPALNQSEKSQRSLTEPLVSELRGFEEAISRGGIDYVGFEAGARNVAVANAFVESCESGQPQSISYS